MIRSLNVMKSNLSRKLRLEEVEQFAKNLDKLFAKLPQITDIIVNVLSIVHRFQSQQRILVKPYSGVHC